MGRKRPLIPAFPVESRLLSWALLAAGVLLVLGGYLTDEDGMLVIGGLCIAGALLALLADWFVGGTEDEE